MSSPLLPIIAARHRTKDPNFSNVSLLLHGEGANGSTTVVDSSSSSKTPTTVFGNAQISTSVAKFGAASLKFDGMGDAILYPHTADLHLSGDFTIEFFIYLLSAGGMILSKGGGSGIAWSSYELAFDGPYVNFAGSSSNSGYDIGSETGATGRIGAPPTNAWSHIAVTRSGNVYRGFLAGLLGYTQTIALSPYDTSPRGLCVGANFAGTWGIGTPSNSINGFIDEFRITKGVARYTSNFTPPTAPFPNS